MAAQAAPERRKTAQDFFDIDEKLVVSKLNMIEVFCGMRTNHHGTVLQALLEAPKCGG